MNTSLDCMPCFVRQALDAARLVSSDEFFQAEIVRNTLQWASECNLTQPPPKMAQKVHRFIREATGNPDPYQSIKNKMNLVAAEFLPELRKLIRNSESPLLTAAHLAIAGNIIDMGIFSQVDHNDIRKSIDRSLGENVAGHPGDFLQRVSGAQHIVYLADNAGEIIFDQLLMEQIGIPRITLAVRGYPILNDICMADVDNLKLPQELKVIHNGSDAPGTLLAETSEEFQRAFDRADLIISKGQGNYETLSDADYPIAFLFQAKCPVIARELNVEEKQHMMLLQNKRKQ